MRVHGRVGVVLLAILLMTQYVGAQSPAAKVSEAERTLVTKAQALESRGRPDIAAQVWSQILLSDPASQIAMEGIARCYRLSGNAKASEAALDRLRRAYPDSPNIGKIQALTSYKTRDQRLGEAGDLAKAGNPEAAMKIYRDYFGDNPPDGEMGLAYYNTLYATADGKQSAIAGMRAMAARNPGDDRYAIALGRMLTYDYKTREEGIRILRDHQSDGEAETALRQALVWDAANPSSAADLREYLKTHGNDAELAARLRDNEAKLAEINSGIARTPAERAAFASLNAHRLAEAEARFTALLNADPKNGRAAAGMGYVRMQQANFGGAVSFFSQSEQNGYHSPAIASALATSRFWFTMGEASQAFDADQFSQAQAQYQAALQMRPTSPEALSGLAGLYVRNEQFDAAISIYQRLLHAAPSSADAWHGLFVAQARAHLNNDALRTMQRFPAAVRNALAHDPDYLQTLAALDTAMGRPDEAQRVLAQALALPFPDNGTNLKTSTRLQYAGILMEARRFDQAAALYRQILGDDSGNISAWMGMVSAEHQLGRDPEAIHDVERMPPAVYESALSDTGFLAMLAAMYQQANQTDIAQGLLERVVRLSQSNGAQPPDTLLIQLAGIYLERNNNAKAYELYRSILTAHPGNLDAWQGLIGTLETTHHETQALAELSYIPANVRQQLEENPQFQLTEAGLYSTAGETAAASAIFSRILAHYRALGQAMPADAEIQYAYLLYNSGNDRGLYQTLMGLGGRPDLTVAQRLTVESIWANWAVRRSATAFDNGNNARALAILDSTAQAFPDNLTVRKAVASGYLRDGHAREALAIYKSVPFDEASTADFQGAIGAALAAGDKTQAEQWLRQAIARFPQDTSILGLAARFEQARGDNARAADYWKAALQAAPPVSPANALAHQMAYADQPSGTQKATTPRQLAALLDPQDEPFQRAASLPPLPSYGPDPYNGPNTAPVVPGSSVGASGYGAGAGQHNAPSALPVYPGAASEAGASATVPTTTTTRLPQADLRSLPAGKGSGSGQSGMPDGSSTSQPTQTTPIQTTPIQTTPSRQAHTTDSEGRMNLPDAGRPVTSRITNDLSQPTASAPYIPPYKPDAVAEPAPQETSPYVPVPAPTSAPSPAPHPPTVMPETVIPDQSVPQASLRLPAAPAAALRAGLRLAAQPMNLTAARAAAMLTDETDHQLTQGFRLEPIANAPVTAANVEGGTAPQSAVPQQSQSQLSQTLQSLTQPGQAQMTEAQYTPSPQDAAAGAYSAQQRPQSVGSPPQPQVTSQPQSQAAVASPAHRARRRGKQSTGSRQQTTVPTLVTAPAAAPGSVSGTQPFQAADGLPGVAPNAPDQDASGMDASGQDASGMAGAGQGVTDQQLQERNLPPLRGPWVRVRREQRPVSPREEAEAQLRAIESGYSPWFGMTGLIGHRTGDPGYSQLTSLQAPMEASLALGSSARLTFIATPAFLDSGQANGSAVIQTVSSSGQLTTGPSPFGTLTGAQAAATPPAQQNSAGIGGEVQLTTSTFGVAGGYTPYGFLVSTFTARAFWHPANGPVMITFNRDPVTDTQLSWAGLRDPGSATATYPGNVWGGVMANAANVQYARGDLLSGYYFGVGGQYIQGYHVEDNARIDGSGGAYWRVFAQPESGSLNIGANFFAMHYSTNLMAFSYGMGGYFSPQAYFLANVPVTWTGHRLTRLHYSAMGSLGIQAFESQKTPMLPLSPQAPGLLYLAPLTSVGPNYDLRAQAAYALSEHWFLGGFAEANNSRNYTDVVAGFSIHYLFRPQPSTVTEPTGLFPMDVAHPFRPLLVP